jgi:hypothetical protein
MSLVKSSLLGFRTPAGVDEIVTGERLQALTEISVVPGHVKRFHQRLDRFVDNKVVFEEYEQLGDADLARLSASRSLFVYTHELGAFLEHIWPRLEGEDYVLMTHNSDFEADPSYAPWLEGTGPKLRRWLAQNVMFRHPKLEPLPIGIANSMWKHGNLRVLGNEIAKSNGRTKDELVFLQFNTKTHPERAVVWQQLREAFPRFPTSPPAALSFRAYLRELGRHRFCICPRGNGIDTHRVWECLYLGVVPIVERSTHVECWLERGVPLLVVDDWSEVTPERLEDEAGRFEDALASWDRAALRMSTYAALVAA